MIATIATIIAAFFGSAAMTAFIKAIAGRGMQRVDIAAKLNEEALEWATELRKDAASARSEAAAARSEAAAARSEAAAANLRAGLLEHQLHRIRIHVFRHDATLDELRELIAEVGASGSTNSA